jgi:hypothetical protein
VCVRAVLRFACLALDNFAADSLLVVGELLALDCVPAFIGLLARGRDDSAIAEHAISLLASLTTDNARGANDLRDCDGIAPLLEIGEAAIGPGGGSRTTMMHALGAMIVLTSAA